MIGLSEMLAGAFGALFTIVVTFYYDKHKNKVHNKKLIKLIMTDVESQQLPIEAYLLEMGLLKNKIETGNGDLGFSIGTFLNTDVYSSNSKIEYHSAFGDSLFKDLVRIYSLLGKLEKTNPYELFSMFSMELNRLENANQPNAKDVKELKAEYLYQVETYEKISKSLISMIEKLRSKAKENFKFIK